MQTALICGAVLIGYVASIFTWPKLRAAVNGLQYEASQLRAQAQAAEQKIKDKAKSVAGGI